MITLRLFSDSCGEINGFELTGHSGFADSGSDIVCAGVSSAAYMCANTLTEVLKLNPEVEISDARMKVTFTQTVPENARAVLDGFVLHISQLSEMYPDFIKIERGAKNA